MPFLKDDEVNESQPWPCAPEDLELGVLDDTPELEDLIEEARGIYLEVVDSPSNYVN